MPSLRINNTCSTIYCLSIKEYWLTTSRSSPKSRRNGNERSEIERRNLSTSHFHYYETSSSWPYRYLHRLVLSAFCFCTCLSAIWFTKEKRQQQECVKLVERRASGGHTWHSFYMGFQRALFSLNDGESVFSFMSCGQRHLDLCARGFYTTIYIHTVHVDIHAHTNSANLSSVLLYSLRPIMINSSFFIVNIGWPAVFYHYNS